MVKQFNPFAGLGDLSDAREKTMRTPHSVYVHLQALIRSTAALVERVQCLSDVAEGPATETAFDGELMEVHRLAGRIRFEADVLLGRATDTED